MTIPEPVLTYLTSAVLFSMRRESVATLQVRHLDAAWGLRGVRVKGGKTRDIPLPTAVTQFLQAYVEGTVAKDMHTPDTPLFWSAWGRRSGGQTGAPLNGPKHSPGT